MGKNEARLNRIARRLDELAPAEPIVFHVVYGDEEMPGYDVVVDGRAGPVIQLRWPEDEDRERMTRQDAPGRA